MEENIEVKDVQKTEYLDKNGLDMLWAKVKENTHNQVEVERNRAVAKENSIADTKADKSALDNYVLSTTLTALEKKVSANTAAISGKQDAGNYLHYKTLNNDGYYEIPSVCVINEDYGTATSVTSDEIKVSNESLGYTIITTDRVRNFYNDNGDFGFDLNSDGIKLQGGDNNHVLTSNGSTIDITEYAKKSEIADKADKTDLTQLQTAVNGKQDKPASGYSYITAKYDSSNFNYTVRCNYIAVTDDRTTAVFSPVGISILGSSTSMYITHDGIKLNGAKFKETEVFNVKGGTIDTTVFALKSELDSYAKKSEILPATKEKLGVVKVGDGLNIADDGTINVDSKLYVTDMVSYGVEWDTTVADPACVRIGNPLLHKQLPIQSEYKGCLVKNGKVNYYLDPNDWSKKADGTPSVLDGTDGDVMVHIPKFYGKSGSNGNKRWVRISTTKIDSSWVEIPEMFVSAYKITTYTDSGVDKVASVVNTTAKYRGGKNRSNYDQYLATDKFRTDLGKPRTSLSRQTMRIAATNSGQELLCYEFYKWIFYWAYVIEYANFNSQKKFNSELTSDGYHQGGLGNGVSKVSLGLWIDYNSHNPLIPCGYTNEFGNFSGEKTTFIKLDSDSVATTINPNRWRGFENPFGDIETCLDGIVLKMDSTGSESKVYTTTDASKFGDDTSVMNIAGIEGPNRGYIVEFDLRETGEIIPQSADNAGSANGSKYKCDYHSLNTNNTNNRMLYVGGTAQFGDMNGLCSFSSGDVGYVNTYIGYRSVIRA